MRTSKGIFGVAATLAIALALVAAVRAMTVVNNGVTLEYPSYPLSGPALLSCEPDQEATANTIKLTGLPEGANVIVTFAWFNPYGGSPNYMAPITYSNVSGGELVAPVSYPPGGSATWPLVNAVTNERAIGLAVFVQVKSSSGALSAKLNTKGWWVRCLPPPPPSAGCTPGYWKQEQHLDSWVPTGYAPDDNFETIFGVDATFDPHTLLDAVWLGGGGENALARHAVAAILNAAHPDIDYQFTIAQIIAGVQNAYATGDFEPFKDQLDAANNAGCKLN